MTERTFCPECGWKMVQNGTCLAFECDYRAPTNQVNKAPMHHGSSVRFTIEDDPDYRAGVAIAKKAIKEAIADTFGEHTVVEPSTCFICGGEGWVCESHTDKPWNLKGCMCGPGQPCACNPSSYHIPPRDPPGFTCRCPPGVKHE